MNTDIPPPPLSTTYSDLKRSKQPTSIASIANQSQAPPIINPQINDLVKAYINQPNYPATNSTLLPNSSMQQYPLYTYVPNSQSMSILPMNSKRSKEKNKKESSNTTMNRYNYRLRNNSRIGASNQTREGKLNSTASTTQRSYIAFPEIPPGANQKTIPNCEVSKYNCQHAFSTDTLNDKHFFKVNATTVTPQNMYCFTRHNIDIKLNILVSDISKIKKQSINPYSSEDIVDISEKHVYLPPYPLSNGIVQTFLYIPQRNRFILDGTLESNYEETVKANHNKNYIQIVQSNLRKSSRPPHTNTMYDPTCDQKMYYNPNMKANTIYYPPNAPSSTPSTSNGIPVHKELERPSLSTRQNPNDVYLNCI